MPATLALVACLILACLAILQLALIAGAPLGRFAWGGKERVLSPGRRAGSAVVIVLYAIFALVILQAADVIAVVSALVGQVAIWVLTAYFFVGFVMNALSRSPSERAVMTPVSLALAALCLIVAVTGHLPR
jgi:hypothetical protein